MAVRANHSDTSFHQIILRRIIVAKLIHHHQLNSILEGLAIKVLVEEELDVLNDLHILEVLLHLGRDEGRRVYRLPLHCPGDERPWRDVLDLQPGVGWLVEVVLHNSPGLGVHVYVGRLVEDGHQELGHRLVLLRDNHTGPRAVMKILELRST